MVWFAVVVHMVWPLHYTHIITPLPHLFHYSAQGELGAREQQLSALNEALEEARAQLSASQAQEVSLRRDLAQERGRWAVGSLSICCWRLLVGTIETDMVGHFCGKTV